ncbi:MAG: hypothetical protein Q9174_003059 [Haloplaca sp. 1 TL-2023]
MANRTMQRTRICRLDCQHWRHRHLVLHRFLLHPQAPEIRVEDPTASSGDSFEDSRRQEQYVAQDNAAQCQSAFDREQPAPADCDEIYRYLESGQAAANGAPRAPTPPSVGAAPDDRYPGALNEADLEAPDDRYPGADLAANDVGPSPFGPLRPRSL